MELVHIQCDYGELVQVEEIRAALEADSDIAVVAMVHHETSVGLLNPIREIGELCQQHDCLFLVDAVSSLGAEDFNVIRDHVDICWSTPNKCLHGVAGVAFLCIAPHVWTRIASIEPRVYYLDLKWYREYAENMAQTPFTPAIANISALDVACEEYLENGIAHRQTMYAERNCKLRAGLRRLGINLLTDTGFESHSIVTACLPTGISFEYLYNGLRNHGFVVYDCKPPLQGRYFQISNMGNLFDTNLEAFLLAVEEVIGHQIRQAAS